MTTLPVLHSTSRADLLAIPSFMFGFQPAESVVLIGMQGKVACFSARLDVDWFRVRFDSVAEQMVNATSQMAGVRFLLLGYSADLDLCWASVMELADVIGPERILEALITDGEHYWSLTDDAGPVEYRFDTSSVAAQAVYSGVNIHSTREELVAPVHEWQEPDAAETTAALMELDGLTAEGALSLLQELAESDPPVTGVEALHLACLLQDEDCAAALLSRLNTTTAEGIWPNLLAARQVAPGFVQATLVALLGVASWLSARGAQASACIEQMVVLDPKHPIGMVLAEVHHKAIAPQRWDEYR